MRTTLGDYPFEHSSKAIIAFTIAKTFDRYRVVALKAGDRLLEALHLIAHHAVTGLLPDRLATNRSGCLENRQVLGDRGLR